MVKILDCCRETLPSVKLIGKGYTDADRDENGSFGVQWGQWFENGWFESLHGTGGMEKISDDFVGAMRCTEAGFEYWIGIFMAPEDPVPQGFASVDIAGGDWGVCYLYGKDGTADLFGMAAHEASLSAWAAAGWTLAPGGWFLERYNCPRYTTPDENGNVILDYCAQLT